MQEVTNVQNKRGTRPRDDQNDANGAATTATEVIEMLFAVNKWLAIGRYHVDKKTGASWGLDKRTAAAFLTFVHHHMSQHHDVSKQGFCMYLLSAFFFKMVHMYNRVTLKFAADLPGFPAASYRLDLQGSPRWYLLPTHAGHLGSLANVKLIAERHISNRRGEAETDSSGRLRASQDELDKTGCLRTLQTFLCAAFTNNQIDAVSVVFYWLNLGPLEDWGFLLADWRYPRSVPQQPIPLLKLALDYHLPKMAKLMLHYLPSSPESITRNLRSCLTSVKDSADDAAAKDEEGLLTVVRDLVENHIDNPERDQEISSGRAAAVLEAAAAGGSFLLFQYLAEKALHPGGRDYKQGKDLSDFRDELGGNLAHTATTHERLRILRHLFETRGFDPEATDTKGLTAFQRAMKLRNGETARFFLGTVYTKNGEKMTADQLKLIIQPLEPETNPGAVLSWAYKEKLFLLTEPKELASCQNLCRGIAEYCEQRNHETNKKTSGT